MGLLRPWILDVHRFLGPGKHRKRLAMRHDRGISALVGAALGHRFGAVDAETVRQIRLVLCKTSFVEPSVILF